MHVLLLAGEVQSETPLCKHGVLSHKAELILQHTLDAVASGNPVEQQFQLEGCLVEALEWQAARSPKQIMEEREAVICALEDACARMFKSGLVADWYAGCDENIKTLCRVVNGPLLEQLAKITQHCDPVCIEFFRVGAPLLGKLPVSGIGTPCADAVARPLSELKSQCQASNAALLRSLKQAEHSDKLLDMMAADAEVGRMTPPVPVDVVDLEAVRLSPRFAVEQEKEDGRLAIRPVDNFSWCARPTHIWRKAAKKQDLIGESVNGFCVATERLHHDHLDKLVAAAGSITTKSGRVCGLFKADIDAAYRRVPLQPSHVWASAVAVLHEGLVWVSMHNCCPFGAVAAVHAWERIGALVNHIARKALKLATCRYVDDYFACEGLETLEHAAGCFARLVRIILGPDALAVHKLAHGPNLCILGVDLALDSFGYSGKPARSKLLKWKRSMCEVLRVGKLSAGDASKLAGRLQWSCQSMFNRLGRAMVRPLYDHVRSGSELISVELSRALLWWLDVFELELVEQRSWFVPRRQPAHLFCDAAGEPAHLASVLWLDGKLLFTHRAPPCDIIQHLRSRSDKQIMGLELLSIALGLSTFSNDLANRTVIIHSDNTGAERATAKGSARCFDHCEIIHEMWTHAVVNHMALWVARVPTELNLADGPSRGDFSLLQCRSAEFRKPSLEERYWSAQAWEHLKQGQSK